MLQEFPSNLVHVIADYFSWLWHKTQMSLEGQPSTYSTLDDSLAPEEATKRPSCQNLRVVVLLSAVAVFVATQLFYNYYTWLEISALRAVQLDMEHMYAVRTQELYAAYGLDYNWDMEDVTAEKKGKKGHLKDRSKKIGGMGGGGGGKGGWLDFPGGGGKGGWLDFPGEGGGGGGGSGGSKNSWGGGGRSKNSWGSDGWYGYPWYPGWDGYPWYPGGSKGSWPHPYPSSFCAEVGKCADFQSLLARVTALETKTACIYAHTNEPRCSIRVDVLNGNTATFNNNVLVKGDLTVNGDLDATMDVTIPDMLTVRQITVTQSAIVTGPLSVTGTATISGATTTGPLTANGDSTVMGNLKVTEDLDVSKDVTIGGDVSIGGDISSGGGVTVADILLTSILRVTKSAEFKGPVLVRGPSTGSTETFKVLDYLGHEVFSVSTAGTSSVLSGVQVNGFADVVGKTTTTDLAVTGTTTLAMTTVNGMMTVKGSDMGSKQTFKVLDSFGNAVFEVATMGHISMTTGATITGPTMLMGDLSVTGNTNLASATVTGTLTVNTLSVNTLATFKGSIIAQMGITATGPVAITGGVTITGDWTLAGTATLQKLIIRPPNAGFMNLLDVQTSAGISMFSVWQGDMTQNAMVNVGSSALPAGMIDLHYWGDLIMRSPSKKVWYRALDNTMGPQCLATATQWTSANTLVLTAMPQMLCPTWPN
eukprot:g81323.t1